MFARKLKQILSLHIPGHLQQGWEEEMRVRGVRFSTHSCVCEQHKQIQKNWQRKKPSPVLCSDSRDSWAPVTNATNPPAGAQQTSSPEQQFAGASPARGHGVWARPPRTPHAKPTHSPTPHSPSPLALGPRVLFPASLRGKRDVLPNLRNSN